MNRNHEDIINISGIMKKVVIESARYIVGTLES